MRLLLKEIEPTSGRIIVNGYDYAKIKSRKIPYLRRQIGFVFQDFRLLQDRNIYDNVAFAQKVVEAPNRHMKRQVLNVLDLVGLADRLKAFPGELSGGRAAEGCNRKGDGQPSSFAACGRANRQSGSGYSQRDHGSP